MTRSIKLMLLLLLAGAIHAQDLIPPTDISGLKAVVIANICGDVDVVTTNGSKLTIDGYVNADNATKRRVKVKTVSVNDTLVVYVESPLARLKIWNDEDFVNDSWSVYDWRDGRQSEEDIDFTIDMKVTIPDGIPLSVSTINEGDITLNRRESPLWVNNVNGSIKLNEVLDVRSARTVNGDVDLYFTGAIKNDGKMYTLNGDINAYYPSGTDVNFAFKSFNGDFYTDTDLETLPSVTKTSGKSKGFMLKVSESIRMKMGSGGAWHNYETFNGNAIVRTKK